MPIQVNEKSVDGPLEGNKISKPDMEVIHLTAPHIH